MLDHLAWLKGRQRHRWRTARMRAFVDKLKPAPHTRVLDVGGTAAMWDLVDVPLDVWLLNQPNVVEHARRHARPDRHFVVGDACDLSRFEDGEFAIVFSNSVIEHLGDPARVKRFAAEVRRVGVRYWVQTPCYLFPIEAHTGWPFYWFYPRALRGTIARRIDSAAASEAVSDPIGGTTWFTLRELRALFPDGEVFTERAAGWPKSWSLYRAGGADAHR
jgi:SAM-dependent methyltransferase